MSTPQCLCTSINGYVSAESKQDYSENVWQIAELKIVGEKMFGEWIDFSQKDAKIGSSWVNHRQLILPNLPNFSTGKHSHYMIYV